MKWTTRHLINELNRLLKPGLIGFFESFEVTEIIGFKKDGTATNFFSLIVAEPGLPPQGSGKPECLTPKRIELKGSEYKFGVFRSRVSIHFLLDVIERFAQNGEWQTGPKPLKVGKLEAVVPQFVHTDFNDPHPWNGVLKNNFYEGSHVLELFDTSKEAARFLLQDSRLLTELSQKVHSVTFMDIDGLSDRLGNIAIQLPVTVISTEVRSSPIGDQIIRVAWHERATPRPLRISCEIYGDSTVDAFDSKTVGLPPITPDDSTFKLRSPGGGARTHIWDDENEVLLGVSPVQTFILMAAISMHVTSTDDPHEPKREFSIPVKGSQPDAVEKVTLKGIDKPYFVGSSAERPREPWSSERIFKLSSRQLQERKEFVQYGMFTGRGREEALADIHWLLQKHGVLGAWLWDPFLNAEDVLRTLFFNPHRDSDLRALSSGRTPKKKKKRNCQNSVTASITPPTQQPQANWKKTQREILEAHCGNKMGLKLDFRVQRGGAGGSFHDRFLIFPQENGRALAWSLGTSVNSLGTSHHILQKVSNGELVQNAFLGLWERLETEHYAVWRAGK
ncbi:VPA1262 family N-terminal domain-containing protein [Pusillimonas sp. NJUB218]|uniref:VPA1262 family N-terminal domain-containing protein n=1 Tax=Pusillimonas sp. NJUB218 TaxID=2023230 RepID=UPI000F4B4BB9|nr:VPA1262 family N-terminal domain-containing protein [Pusillimonas sp. NJUB218]ROT43935.1 hypothetical protein CHR62_15020 [Pusillimonas sp. NJUB218]